MIILENISFSYDRRKNIIENLSLTINDGDRICISGPSGRGKTTLLRLIIGLERPTAGGIINSDNIKIATVFQEDRLAPWKSTLENVAMFSDNETALNIMAELGIEAAAGSMPSELSGGMKRRAALARALCSPFDILVLDEPFTGLDEEMKSVCINAVNRLTDGKTVIAATHESREAAALKLKTITI